MKLPIDTSQMMFLVTAPSEPVLDFETKRPKADQDGQPLFQLQLVAIGDGDAEVISVKVAGKAPDADPGARVRLSGLVATPWEMGDRNGIAYRAERIERVAAAKSGSASSSS